MQHSVWLHMVQFCNFDLKVLGNDILQTYTQGQYFNIRHSKQEQSLPPQS